MKLQEIFDLTPINTSHDFYRVKDTLASIYNEDGRKSSLSVTLEMFDFDHVQYDKIEKEKRIEVRTYMEEGDDKWGGNLYSIFF